MLSANSNESVIRCEVPPVSYREAPVIMGPAWLCVRMSMGSGASNEMRGPSAMQGPIGRPQGAGAAFESLLRLLLALLLEASLSGPNRPPFTSFNPRLGNLCTMPPVSHLLLAQEWSPASSRC